MTTLHTSDVRKIPDRMLNMGGNERMPDAWKMIFIPLLMLEFGSGRRGWKDSMERYRSADISIRSAFFPERMEKSGADRGRRWKSDFRCMGREEGNVL